MAAKLILVANLRLGLAPSVNGLDIPAAHQILLLSITQSQGDRSSLMCMGMEPQCHVSGTVVCSRWGMWPVFTLIASCAQGHSENIGKRSEIPL